MIALVSSALAIAALILEAVLKSKQAREAKTYDNDVKKLDQALAGRDSAALSSLFDELRQPGAPGEGDTGGPDDQAAAQR